MIFLDFVTSLDLNFGSLLYSQALMLEVNLKDQQISFYILIILCTQ